MNLFKPKPVPETLKLKENLPPPPLPTPEPLPQQQVIAPITNDELAAGMELLNDHIVILSENQLHLVNLILELKKELGPKKQEQKKK